MAEVAQLTAGQAKVWAELHEQGANAFMERLQEKEIAISQTRANGDQPTAAMKEAMEVSRFYVLYSQNAAILCRLRALELERGAAP